MESPAVSFLILIALIFSWDVHGFDDLSTEQNITESGGHKKSLRLLVLLPMKPGVSRKLPFGAEMCGAAVFSAFRKIEADNLLSDYNLEATFEDTGCNAIKGIGMAYERLHQERYDAILGPQCSQVCRVVGRLASYLNIPLFSGLCQDVEMSNKNEFSTLTRFLATFEMTGFAVCQMLRNFNWHRVGIMVETDVDIIWLLTKNGLQYAFKRCNVTVAMTTIINKNDNLQEKLESTAEVSRIIVTGTHGTTFRKLMKIAYDKGYHQGDYVFISINYYSQRKIFGDFNWQQGLDDDMEIKAVFPAVFMLSYYNRISSDDYEQFVKDVKEGSAERFGYHYEENEEVPYPAANLYEATYLLGVAFNESLGANRDISDGRMMAQHLWGRSLPSLTGDLTVNSNGDREQAYTWSHMQQPETGQVVDIGFYFSSNKSLVLLTENVMFPGGATGPPPDTPPCGYEGEFCIEDANARLLRVVGIFGGVLIGTILLGFGGIFGFYKKMKYEKDLAGMKWKVNLDDVVMANRSGYSKSMISLLSSRGSTTASTKMTQQFIKTGMFEGQVIAIKNLPHVTQVNLSDRSFLKTMIKLYDLSHPNVVKFVGASIEVPDVHILTEYCVKGSLQDILESDEIKLEWTFKWSLMNDVVEGLSFIQSSDFGYHGNLKSSNCVVDSRFVVKLTDFAPQHWLTKKVYQSEALLWTAPELLTSTTTREKGNSRADIYAYGIILHEIVMREGPFFIDDLTSAADVLEGLIENQKSIRPSVSGLDCPAMVVDLMTQCWHKDPHQRPQASEAKNTLHRSSGIKGSRNIMDNLLARMEQYATNLESLVEERTGKYLEEKKKAEDLLNRLLPSSIVRELQENGYVNPVSFECVTIYFSDVVKFTTLCSRSTPIQVVNMLNDLYTLFDGIIAEYDVYKVETIGDAYMTVSGLPEKNGDRHAKEIAQMALSLRHNISSFKIRHMPDERLLLRIGIHSGPVVSGVVGLTMPRYCLFGDTVNTASRMESHGEALKIHISRDTHELLEEMGEFQMEPRGQIEVKGKGLQMTYWLHGGPDKVVE